MRATAMVIVMVLLAASGAWADGGAPSGQVDDAPRYWRGNLHTHTFWSDGNDFPEMVVEWYVRNDYQFLAISDHNVLNQGVTFRPLKEIEKRSRGKAFEKYLARFGPNWVETRGSREQETLEVRLKPLEEYRGLFEQAGRFLLIPAEEITGEAGNKRAIHINATNLLEAIKPAEGATVVELITKTSEAARKQAARLGRDILIHVNHPNYKWGVTAEDLAAIADERFFEVWNGVDGDGDPGADGYPSTDEIWDIANTLRIAGFRRPPLLGLSNDDSHDYHQDATRAMPGRGWIMVRARFLTPAAIVKALRDADFYSSSGVYLDEVGYDASGGRLSVKIRPCGDETFTTRFIGTRAGASLAGAPRKNSEGAVVETTLDYTAPGKPPIGEVLGESTGLTATYVLKGDELYVRAVVTSSGAPEFPTRESRFKRAWTQPVGWEGRVDAGAGR